MKKNLITPKKHIYKHIRVNVSNFLVKFSKQVLKIFLQGLLTSHNKSGVELE